MKRFFSLFLMFVLLFAGCSFSEKEATDKLAITATIFPQYDFLRRITNGADVELKMLISPGKEVHGFEATLEDIALVADSDLFVYVGNDDDKWIENVPESASVRIALTDIVKSEGDDHVWTSPKNVVKIVEFLSSKLCEIDEENAEIYKENTLAYVDELKQLDSDFEKCVNSAKRKTLVFAERFPFAAFADAYSLKHYSAFEGCSTETEAGMKTINSLIEIIKKENIPAIFIIEFSEGVVAEKISSETGVKVLQLHSCHNVTKEEFESGDTYLTLMRKNLDNLKTALN